MKRWLVIGLVLLLFVIVQAALIPVRIDSPGMTGMNSNNDIQELRITDSRYLENGWVDDNLGLIKKRRGINQIGDNNVVVFTATGYFTQEFDYRQIVGLGEGINSVNVPDVSGAIPPDTTLTYTFLSADTSVFNYSVSGQNGSGIQDSVISLAGIASTRNLDVAYMFGRPVFADGESPPMVYQDRSLDTANSAHSQDTSYFDPWMMSLGLEAPGQLRVGIVHETAPPKGTYRYNLVFGNNTAGAGIPSNFIFPDSQKVFLTLFEGRASYRSVEDTAVTLTAELWKQRVGQPWYLLDTIGYWGKEDVYYIDTFSDNNSAFGVATVRANADFNFNFMNNAAIRRPGGIYVADLLGDSVFYDQSTATEAGLGEDSLSVFVDSFYFFAFAYYDPFLDIEGPIGPVSYGRLNSNDCVDCSGGTDTLLVRGGITASTQYERPLWIRVYRSEGGSDTLMLRENLKLYGLFELRARFPYPKDASGVQSLILGHIPDDSLTTGSQYWIDCSDCDYRDNDILQNEFGDALVRPPFVNGIEIPFSDIEFKSGRLWGIGDPLFRDRLYYSEFDAPHDLNATQFLELNEEGNAAIIALEKIPLGEESILFALKNNSTYLIAGYDPEFDLTFLLLSEDIGALSKQAIINTGDEIFFMSPGMKIYSLSGNAPPKEISQPIEDYIDTLFTDFSTASQTIKTFRLNERVCWSDTANSRVLVFNTRQRTWEVESYGSGVRPIGSFRYDSLNAPAYDEFDYWIYQSDSAEEFRVEWAETVDSVAGSGFRYPLIYQTPYVGDGIGLYEIQRAQIMADWDDGDTLIVYVQDNEGSLIDSIRVVSDARSNRIYNVGFAPNIGSYLSLRLKSGSTTDTLVIHSVVANYRKVSNVALQ